MPSESLSWSKTPSGGGEEIGFKIEFFFPFRMRTAAFVRQAIKMIMVIDLILSFKNHGIFILEEGANGCAG